MFFCVFTNPRRSSRREYAGKIDAVAAAAICTALEYNTTLKYLKFNGEFSGISRLFCSAFMVVRFSASTAFPPEYFHVLLERNWEIGCYHGFCASADRCQPPDNIDVHFDGVLMIFRAMEKNTTLQSLSLCSEYSCAHVWRFGFRACVVFAHF